MYFLFFIKVHFSSNICYMRRGKLNLKANMVISHPMFDLSNLNLKGAHPTSGGQVKKADSAN